MNPSRLVKFMGEVQEGHNGGGGATGQRWWIKEGRLEMKIAASLGLNHKTSIVRLVGKPAALEQMSGGVTGHPTLGAEVIIRVVGRPQQILTTFCRVLLYYK
jgi:hypothetical protein